jgi:hypothetical protein
VRIGTGHLCLYKFHIISTLSSLEGQISLQWKGYCDQLQSIAGQARGSNNERSPDECSLPDVPSQKNKILFVCQRLANNWNTTLVTWKVLVRQVLPHNLRVSLLFSVIVHHYEARAKARRVGGLIFGLLALLLIYPTYVALIILVLT